MKKKFLKIGAFVLAIILTFGLGYIVNGLLGNVVSEFLAKKSAKEYIAKEYKGTDYYIEGVFYDMKAAGYSAEVVSPSSEDSYFTLTINMTGKVLYDTYDYCVKQKGNTAYRVSSEYEERIDEVFDESEFSFKYSYVNSELDHDLIKDDLELDKKYDIDKLGKKAGHITVSIIDKKQTTKKAAEYMLEIKEVLKKSDVSFYSIDISINYSENYDEVNSKNDIYIRDFLYKNIKEKGLEKRIKQSIKESQKDDKKDL